MNGVWIKLTTRLLVWLCLEILLTVQNLDDLADYCEYLSQQQSTSSEKVEWVYLISNR